MAKRAVSHTERGARTAQRWARAIARARLARGFSQSELAERARVSFGSVRRVEDGEAGVALWVWLNVMEALGLLGALENLRDPATDALLDARAPKRAGKPRSDDVDF